VGRGARGQTNDQEYGGSTDDYRSAVKRVGLKLDNMQHAHTRKARRALPSDEVAGGGGGGGGGFHSEKGGGLGGGGWE